MQLAPRFTGEETGSGLSGCTDRALSPTPGSPYLLLSGGLLSNGVFTEDVLVPAVR